MQDRKLDGLVAQHIFGWKWANVDFGWTNGHRGFLVPPDGPDRYSNEGNWDGEYLRAMPKYSRDPQAAAQLKKVLSEAEEAAGAEVSDISDARTTCFESLAKKGIRLRRKEIEVLPVIEENLELDSTDAKGVKVQVRVYQDPENEKFYQVQANEPFFREVREAQFKGADGGNWKRLVE